MIEFDGVDIGAGSKLIKKILKSQKIVKKSNKSQRPAKIMWVIGLEKL